MDTSVIMVRVQQHLGSDTDAPNTFFQSLQRQPGHEQLTLTTTSPDIDKQRGPRGRHSALLRSLAPKLPSTAVPMRQKRLRRISFGFTLLGSHWRRGVPRGSNRVKYLGVVGVGLCQV